MNNVQEVKNNVCVNCEECYESMVRVGAFITCYPCYEANIKAIMVDGCIVDIKHPLYIEWRDKWFVMLLEKA